MSKESKYPERERNRNDSKRCRRNIELKIKIIEIQEEDQLRKTTENKNGQHKI